MKILGIESSCDETSASVVENGTRLLSNVTHSQIDIHAVYGGVVPEVASRSHLEVILPVVEQALTTADCSWDDIDGIAVTYAPGLIGSLLIGTLTARTLALLKNKPLYPVHHVEGHVYANFITPPSPFPISQPSTHTPPSSPSTPPFPISQSPTPTPPSSSPSTPPFPISQSPTPTNPPRFPLLALIVSGGHSQLVLFKDHGDYKLLGQTQDDAVGEAFDKTAKIIGLPYPGGPSISKSAEIGDPRAFELPKAKLSCPPNCQHSLGYKQWLSGEVATDDSEKLTCKQYSFSFSGLKTAVLRLVQSETGVAYDFPSHQLPERVSDSLRANVSASFQRTACETLVDKTEKAYHDFEPASVVIAGGVAANQELRRQLSERLPLQIDYADISLCTDNAGMIASLGYYYAQANEPTDPRDLEVVPSLSMSKTAWAK